MLREPQVLREQREQRDPQDPQDPQEPQESQDPQERLVALLMQTFRLLMDGYLSILLKLVVQLT